MQPPMTSRGRKGDECNFSPSACFYEEQRNTLLFFHGTHSHTHAHTHARARTSVLGKHKATPQSFLRSATCQRCLVYLQTQREEATTCLLAWNVVEISVGAILFELLLLCELLTPRRAVFPTVAFPLCFTQWNLKSKENAETRNGCYF